MLICNWRVEKLLSPSIALPLEDRCRDTLSFAPISDSRTGRIRGQTEETPHSQQGVNLFLTDKALGAARWQYILRDPKGPQTRTRSWGLIRFGSVQPVLNSLYCWWNKNLHRRWNALFSVKCELCRLGTLCPTTLLFSLPCPHPRFSGICYLFFFLFSGESNKVGMEFERKAANEFGILFLHSLVTELNTIAYKACSILLQT